ncbi:MAG: class I SAM-dependent methyltransferase, partial [Gemmatimonadaceae bacterium]
MTIPAAELLREFGNIDIYLFDQLLRGRITERMRVLDAGCGRGRNLVYLLGRQMDVWATDASADAIAATRAVAATLAPALGADHFRAEPVEHMTFADASFDVVLSSAVMHFARDEAHWHAML